MARVAPDSGARGVMLRDVTESDLPMFFDHQLDPDATRMAAFPARDWAAFSAHWTKILADETIAKQTILHDGQVAGNIVSWGQAAEREVGYWIGREHWGRGVATQALTAFLNHEKTRPLNAHVAKHNVASIRVLQKCGFGLIREEQAVSNAGGEAVDELILGLGAETETQRYWDND